MDTVALGSNFAAFAVLLRLLLLLVPFLFAAYFLERSHICNCALCFAIYSIRRLRFFHSDLCTMHCSPYALAVLGLLYFIFAIMQLPPYSAPSFGSLRKALFPLCTRRLLGIPSGVGLRRRCFSNWSLHAFFAHLAFEPVSFMVISLQLSVAAGIAP